MKNYPFQLYFCQYFWDFKCQINVILKNMFLVWSHHFIWKFAFKLTLIKDWGTFRRKRLSLHCFFSLSYCLILLSGCNINIPSCSSSTKRVDVKLSSNHILRYVWGRLYFLTTPHYTHKIHFQQLGFTNQLTSIVPIILRELLLGIE